MMNNKLKKTFAIANTITFVAGLSYFSVGCSNNEQETLETTVTVEDTSYEFSELQEPMIEEVGIVEEEKFQEKEIIDEKVEKIEEIIKEYECLFQENKNLVLNSSFTEDGKEWDMRPGRGPDGVSDLGIINYTIFRTAPAGLELPFSDYCNNTNNNEWDRTVWPVMRTRTDPGDLVLLRAYVMFPDHPDDISMYYVDPTEEVRGHLGGYKSLGYEKENSPWAWRGGARLGMDFYDANNGWLDFDMRIADWTLEPDRWYELVMAYIAPADSYTVVPWIQAFEPKVPISIYADDFQMVIIKKGSDNYNSALEDSVTIIE